MIKGKATKNMFLAYETNIKDFKKSVVKVGILQKQGQQSHEGSEDLTVYQVAATHEYGSPERGIPKRSFIREPIINNQKKINKFIKTKFSQVTNNTMTSKKALNSLGQVGLDLCRKSFTNNDWEALKPSTIKAKGNKNNPLINTSQMRQSLSYEIQKA